MSLYDASALWVMLRDNDRAVRKHFMADRAPLMLGHTPAEFLHVLRHRSLSAGRPIDDKETNRLHETFLALDLAALPLDLDLQRRAFTLRHNLTGYDAFYVAAADREGLALVARDKGHRAMAQRLGIAYVPVRAH